METIDNKWLESHKWMLRSSNKGASFGSNFKWKKKGTWTFPEYFDMQTDCGSGLHGNVIGHSGYGFDYPDIELCEWDGRYVKSPDKIKVEKARIVARNEEIPLEAFIQTHLLEHAVHTYLAYNNYRALKKLLRSILRSNYRLSFFTSRCFCIQLNCLLSMNRLFHRLVRHNKVTLMKMFIECGFEFERYEKWTYYRAIFVGETLRELRTKLGI